MLAAVPSSVPLPPDLFDRPFRRADLCRWGLPEQVVRGRRFRPVFRGVYAATTLPDTLRLRVDAARLVLPASAVFSHHTAAQLRDLPVPDESRVHVTVPVTASRSRVRGIVVHRAPVGAASCVHGVPVSSAERTFTDLGRGLGLVDAVVLGDAMVRRGFTSERTLRDAAAHATGRGVLRVRRAAGLVRAGVDSPMESRLRLLLVAAGLPCPEPGLEVLDAYGQWIATVDLQYVAERIALEYDGDLHRTSKRKWRHDVATRELLRDLGWTVLVVTANDVYVQPQRTLVRVHDALRERGHPEVPDALDPRWQDLFQPRGYLSDRW